jgi:hypothetical protein
VSEKSSTRECSRPGCNERYPLVLRGGRNSGKARAGRKQAYHQGRRYCSPTCRKLASKARALGPARALQPSPRRAAREGQKPAPATGVLSTVTSVPSTVDISIGYEGQKSGRASLQMPPSANLRTFRGTPSYPTPTGRRCIASAARTAV